MLLWHWSSRFDNFCPFPTCLYFVCYRCHFVSLAKFSTKPEGWCPQLETLTQWGVHNYLSYKYSELWLNGTLVTKNYSFIEPIVQQ